MALSIEREELMRLYKLAVDEQHFYLEAHHKRIDFYSGLTLALLTGTAVGLFQAKECYHYAYLCVAPLLMLGFSHIAIQGTRRVYQRLLETITVRAKVEQELGFTGSQPQGNEVLQPYWRTESLIPQRHIEARTKFESSSDFIAKQLSKGLQLWATRLLRGFQVWSVALFAGLVFLAVWNC